MNDDDRDKGPELLEDFATAWPSVMIAIGLGLIVAHFITSCGHA